MAKNILILFGFLCLAGLLGCVPRLSSRGTLVQVVPDASMVKNCKSKGVVTGSAAWGLSGAQGAEGALNEVRNKAAYVGANTILITNTNHSDYEGTITTGIAYECQKNGN